MARRKLILPREKSPHELMAEGYEAIKKEKAKEKEQEAFDLQQDDLKPDNPLYWLRLHYNQDKPTE